jgi:hypothetical protein
LTIETVVAVGKTRMGNTLFDQIFALHAKLYSYRINTILY